MEKLTYYGGDGWGSVRKPHNIKVKYGDKKTKHFTSVTEAQKFYISLDCEKAAWDETGMELLECHHYSNDNDGIYRLINSLKS